MNSNIYVRPDKPLRMPVRKRQLVSTDIGEQGHKSEDVIFVHAASECHVTPNHIAKKMIDYAVDFGADIYDIWCDPESGTGNILKAIQDHGVPNCKLFGVEIDFGLVTHSKKRLNMVNIYHECFLEFTKRAVPNRKVDVIIMNPPFRQTSKHINSALSLLGETGVCIALVPTTFNHDDCIELEPLSNDTFANAKVNTKIVAFVR